MYYPQYYCPACGGFISTRKSVAHGALNLFFCQNPTSTCQKAGRLFVSAQNTINSMREIGLQKSLHSCTHALIY